MWKPILQKKVINENRIFCSSAGDNKKSKFNFHIYPEHSDDTWPRRKWITATLRPTNYWARVRWSLTRTMSCLLKVSAIDRVDAHLIVLTTSLHLQSVRSSHLHGHGMAYSAGAAVPHSQSRRGIIGVPFWANCQCVQAVPGECVLSIWTPSSRRQLRVTVFLIPANSNGRVRHISRTACNHVSIERTSMGPTSKGIESACGRRRRRFHPHGQIPPSFQYPTFSRRAIRSQIARALWAICPQVTRSHRPRFSYFWPLLFSRN